MKIQTQTVKMREGVLHPCDPYIIVVLENAAEAEMLWHLANHRPSQDTDANWDAYARERGFDYQILRNFRNML